MAADVSFAVAELQARLFTEREFNRLLDRVVAADDALNAVTFTVEKGRGEGDANFGKAGGGAATSTETNLAGGWTVRMSVWRDMSAALCVTNDDLWSVIRAFWRADERSPSGRIPSGQFPAIRDALSASVDAWASSHVAVGFADIDRFKAFNDIHDWDGGNVLIGAAAQALAAAAPPSCVVVHLSGDEFLVFVAGETAHEALAVCAALRSAAEAALLAAEAEAGGTQNTGLSMGVASFAPGDADTGRLFEHLRERAGKAMKPDGTKRYGVVSVSSGELAPPVVAADADGLAVLLTASRLTAAVPFGNSWLNVLADRAAGAAEAGAGGVAALLVDSVADVPLGALRTQAGELLRPPGDVLNGEAAFAPLELALALAAGVARAVLAGRAGPWELSVAWDGEGARLMMDGVDVFTTGTEPQQPRTAAILRAGHAESGVAGTTRAMLVRIGAGSDELPVELFADQVYVDDRPSVGGGLPDLWEAAVAQVVDAAASNPNIGRVYIVGNADHAPHTVRLLEDSLAWVTPGAADALAYKLGIGTARISDVGRRLKGGARRVASLDDVVADLLGFFETAPPLAAAVDDPRARTAPRALRSSDVSETYRLRAWDGCRVRTAFQAFPVALDLLRHSGAPRQQDQNQRSYLELSDFRIVLENPTADPVPAFYLHEKDRLDEYYEAEFVSPGGLFRSALDADGQLTAVVEHVAGALTRGTSTRRAVLVLPHRRPDSDELSPLGLVSIRLAPRLAADGTVLDTSFSWRTVEALVGLPYSLYGSIRFAQELTVQVRRLLPAALARATRPGTVSFIAHSLHLFTDPYAQRIARQIVAEETE